MAIENNVYIAKLLRELRRSGRSTVLHYRDESFSGEALLALIFRYAHVLRDLGIRRGTLLGMFAPNRPEAIAIRYAAHVLGAATVYLSVPPTEGSRQALVDQIAPDLLVLFPETIRYLGQRVCRSLQLASTKLDPEADWMFGLRQRRWIRSTCWPIRTTSLSFLHPAVLPECQKAVAGTLRHTLRWSAQRVRKIAFN